MKPDELHEQWQEPAEEAVAAVAQWRAAHPKATLAEIEQAGDRADEPTASTDDRAVDPSECPRWE